MLRKLLLGIVSFFIVTTGAHSYILRVFPVGDVLSTGWTRNPASGTFYSKVDDTGNLSDYVSTTTIETPLKFTVTPIPSQIYRATAILNVTVSAIKCTVAVVEVTFVTSLDSPLDTFPSIGVNVPCDGVPREFSGTNGILDSELPYLSAVRVSVSSLTSGGTVTLYSLWMDAELQGRVYIVE